MTKLLGFLLILGMSVHAATVPTLDLKNQFGEVQNDFVVGGSGMIEVKFTVDAASATGLGHRGITTSSGGDIVKQVYMNTTVTPAGGNPNPSPGYIVVQLNKGYSGFLNALSSFTSPPDSSLVSVTAGLTKGKPYEIYSVGTTTAAQWQFLGLPANLIPTPSQSFLAITGAAGSGTGQVTLAHAAGSGVDHLEMVGASSLNINTTDSSGGQLILQILGATNSSTTTFTPTAPTVGTGIHLMLQLTPVAGSPL